MASLIRAKRCRNESSLKIQIADLYIYTYAKQDQKRDDSRNKTLAGCSQWWLPNRSYSIGITNFVHQKEGRNTPPLHPLSEIGFIEDSRLVLYNVRGWMYRMSRQLHNILSSGSEQQIWVSQIEKVDRDKTSFTSLPSLFHLTSMLCGLNESPAGISTTDGRLTYKN